MERVKSQLSIWQLIMDVVTRALMLHGLTSVCKESWPCGQRIALDSERNVLVSDIFDVRIRVVALLTYRERRRRPINCPRITIKLNRNARSYQQSNIEEDLVPF